MPVMMLLLPMSGYPSLFIGSGFGRLSMENSIAAILLGISKANKALEKIDEHVPRIKNVEFIEHMDHIAANAFAALHQIERKSPRVKISLNKKVQKNTEEKKDCTIKKMMDGGTIFLLSNYLSKIAKTINLLLSFYLLLV